MTTTKDNGTLIPS